MRGFLSVFKWRWCEYLEWSYAFSLWVQEDLQPHLPKKLGIRVSTATLRTRSLPVEPSPSESWIVFTISYHLYPIIYIYTPNMTLSYSFMRAPKKLILCFGFRSHFMIWIGWERFDFGIVSSAANDQIPASRHLRWPKMSFMYLEEP